MQKKEKDQYQRLNKEKKAIKQRNSEMKQDRKLGKNKTGFMGFLTSLLSSKKRKKDIVPTTVQDTLPYKSILPDGIMVIDDKTFSKTLEFFDVNYQLAQNDDKSLIFESYCDFLNYFDSSIRVQITFLNRKIDVKEYEKEINIREANDEFNHIRKEYVTMLRNQLAKGNNGLVKTKYITFTIEADNLKLAKPKLERIETEIQSNFKTIGAKTKPLDGFDRLKLLHEILNTNQEKFVFDWKSIPKSGLSTKDFIVPSSFEFAKGNFKTGRKIGNVTFLQILAPELSDKLLKDFLDTEKETLINFHIRSLDQSEAIRNVKRMISAIDRMKIDEQKKAVRAGYDMDIIPSDLNTYAIDAKNLMDDLQTRNERMFLVTILITSLSAKKEDLDNNNFQMNSIAQKHNCNLKLLDYQQEDGFMSSLPLGMNKINIQRGLTTSSVAIFVPFTTQELFVRSEESMYYGLNALSNNLIMADRKKLKNPNGLILGTPGAGKSFSAKREIVNAFLNTDDDINICDPESEYLALTRQLKGQIIEVSTTSKDFINPMDINLDIDESNPIALKSEFLMSFCELVVGDKNGLSGLEVSIIDRCVREVYSNYINDPMPENMPLLGDLYDLIKEQPEKEAKRIATSLEIYVQGSLNVFNHHTNVNIENRLVVYDIRKLGNQLKKIGMLIVQDQMWNKVTKNRAQGKSTWSYLDEFHLLLKESQTAQYAVETWKRYRKYGGIPTGITQNVKDFLASKEIENIFDNSDFILMLNQAGSDREILQKQLGISPHQMSYVKNSNAGEGLIFYGNVIIPFKDNFPKDTLLYRIMTTKLEEASAMNE